jgi:hypothetical protein
VPTRATGRLDVDELCEAVLKAPPMPVGLMAAGALPVSAWSILDLHWPAEELVPEVSS